jgi:hypothetical protein
LLNSARHYNEKEYTLEYISSLIKININEMKEYVEGNKEPDEDIKQRFVDVFGVNRDWMLFNQGNYPFATNLKRYKNGTNIKFIKTVSDKGGLVAWKNMGGDKQPQVTIDYDLAPIAQTFEVTVRTEPIDSIQPVDPPKQEQPKVEDPKAVEPEKKEEPNYQTKEVVTNKEAMDASPKTADESSITLAYKLIGASLFTMMALYIVSIINKRKQKF